MNLSEILSTAVRKRFEQDTYLKKIDDVRKVIVLYGSNNTEDKTIPPIEIPIKKVISIEGEMFVDTANE